MGSPDKPTTNGRNMTTIDSANQRLRELDRLRREEDALLLKINTMHKKLRTKSVEQAEKLSVDIWTRLRSYYVDARSLAEKEENCLKGIQSLQLDTLIAPVGQQATHRRKPASTGGDPKRKRVNANSNESPRVAAAPAVNRTPSPHMSISVGDQVAARISHEDADSHVWIVVKVTRIDRDGNKFEVVDEEPDDDGESGGRAYKLPVSCIIPFPKKSDANPAPDFPQGSHVLAVYPGTTALYKASVVGPHRKKVKLDDVVFLEFDGDEEEGGGGLPKRPVSLANVVTLPEGHRQ